MKRRGRARRHDQPPIRRARERSDNALDLAQIACIDRAHLQPEGGRHALNDTELGGTAWCSWVPKDRNSRYAWRNLLEQLQPFPGHAVFESHETSGVATRLRQALDKA